MKASERRRALALPVVGVPSRRARKSKSSTPFIILRWAWSPTLADSLMAIPDGKRRVQRRATGTPKKLREEKHQDEGQRHGLHGQDGPDHRHTGTVHHKKRLLWVWFCAIGVINGGSVLRRLGWPPKAAAAPEFANGKTLKEPFMSIGELKTIHAHVVPPGSGPDGSPYFLHTGEGLRGLREHAGARQSAVGMKGHILVIRGGSWTL
ncbi:hypothetical protein EYF80_041405 [Liparis tanakae]|uniref:Uncharacterized protein n=1 Tax=Liparis tanakae TaxID=230148 RepID=A0A4Z2G4G2_9TELE|nr:hypothetical protein EYF80_041405 [Liparis tanakae]